MTVTRLDWDSDFWDLRIGKTNIASEDDGEMLASQVHLMRESFDLIYVFAQHGLFFSGNDAKCVDEKIVYSFSDLPGLEAHANVIVWNRTRGVTEDLLHLALLSGHYSRFKQDNRFPVGGYERLYSRWIDQSVNQVMATEVFCYLVDNIPRGLVTLERKDGTGNIGLVAVHEDFQHRGIGAAMMQYVISYSNKKRIDELIVTTQLKNRPACKLYEKSGFKVKSVTDVWHWWL